MNHIDIISILDLRSYIGMLFRTNIECSINICDVITCIATVVTTVIAVWAFKYTREQYNRYLEKEQSDTLSHYNERYSRDLNIKKVVKYLIDKKDNPNNEYTLNTFEKEMFLRFFEELQYAIEQKSLSKEIVYDMFSYYAIEAYKEKENFYKNEEENNWLRFKTFAESMLELQNNRSDN